MKSVNSKSLLTAEVVSVSSSAVLTGHLQAAVGAGLHCRGSVQRWAWASHPAVTQGLQQPAAAPHKSAQQAPQTVTISVILFYFLHLRETESPNSKDSRAAKVNETNS